MTCENIQWVSPVVCWFGNDMNAADCKIMPAVEFKTNFVHYSENWQVGKYDRNNAYEISKDDSRNPTYGGTVNDATVLRYLEELRRRSLKIMFYPMIFMDVTGKPWRGHLKCAPEYVHDFFTKPQGYNEFILHYANLVKNHIDAFVIGSELIGLTKIRYENSFPAVDELINLAKLVKEIVGENVLVTYAADWSEYHHTKGGWYNLDPLWASQYIDFIGIDAYFPITNTSSSIITEQEIELGFQSGEGYDYYLDGASGKKHPLSTAYAWKNIEYWWNNKHQNPDGQLTNWQPKSKKIWFTEFGFPSIDKATNQPNVFFDPLCLDGGIPKYSNGEVDFSIQRKAIKAFLKFWSNKEYIEQMFLWTWDARPYPAWPHMNIWRDGYLWEKGHWVNNKFTSCNLAAVIAEISNRSGINLNQLDFQNMDEALDGVFFSNQITSLEAIGLLRAAYFFDIDTSTANKISFIKRGERKHPITIDSEGCIQLSDDSFLSQIEIPKEMILSEIDLYSINKYPNYDAAHYYIHLDHISAAQRKTVRLPIILSKSESERIGELILQNAQIENHIIYFMLDHSSLFLQPCDFITLHHDGQNYNLRIIEVKFTNWMVAITAIIDDISIYHHKPIQQHNMELLYKDNACTDLIILDLPFYLNKDEQTPYLAILLSGTTQATLYQFTINLAR